MIHIEFDREPDRERLAELHGHIDRVLGEVRLAVEDWQAMRSHAEGLIHELDSAHPPISADDLHETQSFLQWLTTDHFTFLGYREYALVTDDGARRGSSPIRSRASGSCAATPDRAETILSGKALELAKSPSPLVLTKANSVSTVHRRAYLDYIGVKRFGPDGAVIGERRFLGLYTTAAYNERPYEIPLIRGKVAYVLHRAGFPAAQP